MKIILCVPFPCKGHVPLLVFLCDENQALTSARFLENKFWKKTSDDMDDRSSFREENISFWKTENKKLIME